MIAQRITYVACELVDGKMILKIFMELYFFFTGLGRPDAELSEDQRRLKIT